MPDEIEVPLEDVHEKVHELHEERHGEPEAKDKEGWTRFVAVATALLAVIAAIGALQSGLLINESLLEKNAQIGHLTEASDQWNYYQATGLRSLIYKTTAQQLPPGSPYLKEDADQAKHYKDKQASLMEKAQDLTNEAAKDERASAHYLERHHVFAVSVSLCQIAIALSAVAALMRRRGVWIAGLLAGSVGTILLIYGFLH